MTRILVASCVLLSVVAGAGITGRTLSRAQDNNVILLTHASETDESALARQLSPAQRVSSVSDLQATVKPDSLVVIDRSAFADEDNGFVRDWVAQGHPVIALDVPLADLMGKAGYRDAIAARDESFVKIYDSAQRLPALPSEAGYYSGLYVTTPDANGVWHNGSFQQYEREGLFGPEIESYSLIARGLTKRHGRIVPMTDLDHP
jgi:hypothetical protein